MKRILENTGEKNKFLKKITRVRDEANALIELYHNAQPFARITNREEAEMLLRGAAGVFDQTILRNAPFDKGHKNINVTVLCNLLNLDRGVFLAEAEQLVSWSEYEHQKEYLMFSEGQFIFNEAALQKQLDAFDIYAKSDKAIAHVQYLEQFRDTLNEAITRFQLSPSNAEPLAKMFGFQYYEHRLSINPYELAKKIQYLNTL